MKESEPQELHRTNPDEKITFRIAPIKRKAGEGECSASASSTADATLRPEPNDLSTSASTSSTYCSSVSLVHTASSTSSSSVPMSSAEQALEEPDSPAMKREPQEHSETAPVDNSTISCSSSITPMALGAYSSSCSELKPAPHLMSKPLSLSLTKRFGVTAASASVSASIASSVEKKPSLASSGHRNRTGVGDREERVPVKHKTAMEQIREEETRAKQRRLEQSANSHSSSATSELQANESSGDEAWLRPGILVKINNEKLPPKYHGKKAVVLV